MNNKEAITFEISIFILGAIYSYRRNYIDRVTLEYYIFNLSALRFFRNNHFNKSFIRAVGLGTEIEDVERWLAPRLPDSSLDDLLKLIELNTIDTLLEYDVPESIVTFESKCNDYTALFYNDYSYKYFYYLLILGLNKFITYNYDSNLKILVYMKTLIESIKNNDRLMEDKDFKEFIYSCDDIIYNDSNYRNKNLLLNKLELMNMDLEIELIGYNVENLIEGIDLKKTNSTILEFSSVKKN